jgi:hypothetical protein
MQQQWNLKSRSHACARTGRPFEPGEVFHTAIFFDTASGEFERRDVSDAAWKEEIAERQPMASWKSEYEPPESAKPKAELTSKESAENLLRRLIEEDEPSSEHARYILVLMLERKKQLVPKEAKPTETGRMLIYEHRKSGEVYIIRDPELRLDEVDAVQEEVATLLGFAGPAADAAAAAGMKFTPEGKLVPKGNGSGSKESPRPRRTANPPAQPTQ